MLPAASAGQVAVHGACRCCRGECCCKVCNANPSYSARRRPGLVLSVVWLYAVTLHTGVGAAPAERGLYMLSDIGMKHIANLSAAAAAASQHTLRMHHLHGTIQSSLCCFGFLSATLSVATLPMQDVAWHTKHEHVFGSVGDDKQLIIWDTRQSGNSWFLL